GGRRYDRVRGLLRPRALGVDRVDGEHVLLAVGQPGDVQGALVGAHLVGLPVTLDHVVGDGRAVRVGRPPREVYRGVARGRDHLGRRAGRPDRRRLLRRRWRRVRRRVTAQDVVGVLVDDLDPALVVDDPGTRRVGRVDE